MIAFSLLLFCKTGLIFIPIKKSLAIIRHALDRRIIVTTSRAPYRSALHRMKLEFIFRR